MPPSESNISTVVPRSNVNDDYTGTSVQQQGQNRHANSHHTTPDVHDNLDRNVNNNGPKNDGANNGADKTTENGADGHTNDSADEPSADEPDNDGADNVRHTVRDTQDDSGDGDHSMDSDLSKSQGQTNGQKPSKKRAKVANDADIPRREKSKRIAANKNPISKPYVSDDDHDDIPNGMYNCVHN